MGQAPGASQVPDLTEVVSRLESGAVGEFSGDWYYVALVALALLNLGEADILLAL